MLKDFIVLQKSIYESSDSFLLIFDVTREKTFNKINNCIRDIKGNSIISEKVIFLIGNIIDKSDRMISKEQGEELANALGIKYFEISCKYNINISEIIANMILECLLKTNIINSLDKKRIGDTLNININKRTIINLEKYINY